MSLNYAQYLKLDEMLELQVPLSDPVEHDEYLFIIIHQTFELWFKQILIEFEKAKTDLSGNDLHGAMHTFKRLRTIVKIMVAQMDILETMTPMSFGSFRERLDTASGFQSLQFREFEFTLGYKRREMINYQEGEAAERLRERLQQRSLHDHFYDFLEAQGVSIPPELKNRDLTEPTRPDAVVQAGLLELYRRDPNVVILLELMTDFDEGLQEWRYRHVKAVERTIGSKRGTGGSLGVEFLKASLFMSAFPDLWAIRHEF
jgi:tryptophan 2,3-dioxygenase